ncbi:nucleoside-diphosphate-sugar epimerase family protein [Apodospora peruviana]|uniref:Nucleoside-diphosphate-sugar epimerase family protein n=1 Tax=Apodospora peruviana TaxID=516989 RepID=A0AAE0ICS2_9PEZI|nr:nucleoside-diphosphate-sugar epimerase family protein [Apodospora peruviana]
MAILLTGGTGAQTAVQIASRCAEANIPFLYASRRGSDDSDAPPAVKFDWTDSSTFAAPFAHIFPGRETITAVYLTSPPGVQEAENPMNAFVDYAITRGVKRFVLMAGTTAEIGRPGPGKVWEHLAQKGVEYAVCRPSWFMENFSSGLHVATIKNESKVYSCCGNAKVPHISAIDIGNVAFAALTQTEPPNTDFRIVGPELLTYDEVAAKLSKVLGRHIENVNLSQEDRVKHLTSLGLPGHVAKFMGYLEGLTAGGFEEHMNDTVEKVTGKKPIPFEEFVENNKHLWESVDD